jgi:hypothetical protein
MPQTHWVRVTTHAIVRLRERFPEFTDTSEGALRLLVAGEVTDAIASQRLASRLPRFARPEGGGRPKSPGKIRYLWTADERRVYTVDRGSTSTVVITAVAAPADSS